MSSPSERFSSSLRANALVFLALFLFWSWFVQSFGSPVRLAIDGVVFLAAFAAATRFLGDRRGFTGRWRLAATAALLAWLSLSALAVIPSDSLPLAPDRFGLPLRTEGSRDLAPGGQWATQTVGVALSGGGYRAAVYHAGVLDSLDRLRVPVTHLSAVSGGSIVGVYYALGGDPRSFVQAVAAGSFNLRRHLAMAQTLSRLPWSGFDRRSAQAGLLRSRLGLDRAVPIRAACQHCPSLILGATDLNFGFQVGLLDDGLVLVDEPSHWSRLENEMGELADKDLAERAAISGAFPGAFPAFPVQLETRRQPIEILDPGELPIRRLLVLADGGIYDNTGLLLLRAAQERAAVEPTMAPWQVGAILVSDASAIFGMDGDAGELATLGRAVEVATARGAREFQKNELKKRDLVWITPQSSFLPLSMVFDAPERELSGSTANTTEHSIWFSPLAFPNPLLEALGEILLAKSPSAREVLASFLELREALLPYPALLWTRDVHAVTNLLSHSLTRDECERRAPTIRGLEERPDLQDLACAGVPVRQAFREELARLTVVFRDTSTLQDQLGTEFAADLFALGQAQALLSWPRLARLLQQTPTGPLPAYPPTLSATPSPGSQTEPEARVQSQIAPTIFQ